jgi:hypothetical protein
MAVEGILHVARLVVVHAPQWADPARRCRVVPGVRGVVPPGKPDTGVGELSRGKGSVTPWEPAHRGAAARPQRIATRWSPGG